MGVGKVRLVSRILICEGVISSSQEPPGSAEGGGDGRGMEGWRDGGMGRWTGRVWGGGGGRREGWGRLGR